MTDQELDVLLDKAKPALRTAIRAVLEKGAPGYLLTIAQMSLPNGQTWDITCGMFNEPLGKMVEAIAVTGFKQQMDSFAKLQAPAGTPGGKPAAGPPKGPAKAFSVPGV
jgi:hypothetical protein